MTRIESPSSINTYLQCPRKYFYSYKMALPRRDSIATITGKSVHDALEKFYLLGSLGMNEKNYVVEFQHRLMNTFNDIWASAVPSLLKLDIKKDLIMKYYEDTMGMLNNFASLVINRINLCLKDGMTFEEAFEFIKPETEIYLASEKEMVRGYVDVIHKNGDSVHIVDYKTSKRDHMSDDYKRQLAIYAMMYQENFNKLPEKVGILFLRQGTERDLRVDESLIEEARKACALVHSSTVSDNMDDYPRKLGFLCKWATGQCDFYDPCYKVKTMEEFLAGLKKD